MLMKLEHIYFFSLVSTINCADDYSFNDGVYFLVDYVALPTLLYQCYTSIHLRVNVSIPVNYR